MNPILRLEDGTFDYSGKAIFRYLNLEVLRGEILCILGPNGCGKTTLLHCLGGFLDLRNGCVKLNSTIVAKLSELELARKIAFVFQNHETPFPYSVLDVALMGRAPHIGIFSSPSRKDEAVAEDSLARVGIRHLKEKLFTRISGGERQLVLIARALSQEPEILLMDEPTSHLDFKNQTLILQTVNKLANQGLAIVMASHFPDHALLFSHKTALMKDGTFLATGLPSEIITDENLGALYDMEISVINTEDPYNGNKLTIAVPRLA